MKIKQLFASGTAGVFSLALATCLHAQNQAAPPATQPGAQPTPRSPVQPQGPGQQNPPPVQGQQPFPPRQPVPPGQPAPYNQQPLQPGSQRGTPGQPLPPGQQQPGAPGQPNRPGQPQTGPATASARLQDQGRASKFIGMQVGNQQGETLGKVADIAIDVPTGRIAYVVIDASEYLGAEGQGQKLIAVPPQALSMSQGTLMLNADRQRMLRAPSFAETELPGTESPNWGGTYWGAGGPARSGGQMLNGRILDVDYARKTITVEGQGGRQILNIDPATTFELSGKSNAQLSDLASGDQITVVFTPRPDGSVVASTIRSGGDDSTNRQEPEK